MNPQSTENQQREFALRGFYIGAGIPLFLGIAWLIYFRMSLPELKPGDGHCLTGGLWGVFLILFGTPLGAMVGALTGSAMWVSQQRENGR